MKIAVVSESPADEAAIKILVDAILGQETELVSAARLRPGGWPQVLQLLPSILKALHYYTDAEGIAVVVDSDSSPVYLPNHPTDLNCHSECRLCLSVVNRQVYHSQQCSPFPIEIRSKLP